MSDENEKRYAHLECFELCMELDDAQSVSQQGPCDSFVADVLEAKYIQDQLSKLSDDDLKNALRPYGAWEEEELEDRNDNEARVVWIAGGQISDEHFENNN